MSSPHPDPTERLQELVVTRHGGPEVLELRTRAVPDPGAGEVRVRVEAAAACYTDMLIRRGQYPGVRERPPIVVGYDFVGRVDAVGSGSGAWSVGDRVADLSVTGGAASHVVVAADRLVAVPDAVDAAQAETVILTYLTAYQALVRFGGATPGRPVLVVGASGAVGRAALDIARAVGLDATGVASGAKASVVTDLGAAHVAYDDPRYRERLAAAARRTGGFGTVVDTAGSPSPRALARLTRGDGRVVVVGFAGDLGPAGAPTTLRALSSIVGAAVGVRIADLLDRSTTLSFYNITQTRDEHPDWYAEDLKLLLGWLDEARIAPEVAARYSLDDGVAAHRRLEEGGLTGRIVLTT